MKEYKIIDLCLKTLKESGVDGVQKLAIENLLVGMKMLLLADIYCRDRVAPGLPLNNFEELFTEVKQACTTGTSAEGMKGVIEHAKKMHSAMAQCLDVS